MTKINLTNLDWANAPEIAGGDEDTHNIQTATTADGTELIVHLDLTTREATLAAEINGNWITNDDWDADEHAPAFDAVLGDGWRTWLDQWQDDTLDDLESDEDDIIAEIEGVHSKTFELRDAFYEVYKVVEVIWVEEDVTWVDSALGNIGEKWILWGEGDCPVRAGRSEITNVDVLDAPPTEVTGDTSYCPTPWRVYRAEELDEHCYLVRTVR